MRTLSRTTKAILAAGILASSLSVVAATTATANSADLTASLQPVALNGVDGSGTALVTVRGTRIDIAMAASGLLADAPHAAHIHFGADARHECPGASDDLDASGTLNTSEGGPAYGPVAVSLTKTGDTSPASALAIDRFDTAPRGNLTYERGQIKVSQDVAKAVTRGEAVIVIHGVDHNHSGAYDGATASDLDPSLPTEATDPALCGVISQS
jgi:Cu/Zn superoxide dismutase